MSGGLLSREGRAAPPVRLVHLGLGNFFRAHQAWYTDRAGDGWGIAAFSGRRAELADALTAQDGLYTLVTRAGDGDGHEVIASLARAYPAARHDAWLEAFASSDVRGVTITVTEAGYLRAADGGLDRDRAEVQADAETLRRDPTAAVRTAPARLLAGVAARRRADAGPLTLIPCDNLPDNGAVVARVVADFADLIEPGLREWLEASVTTVTTMVDRITPRTTPEDVAALGEQDRCPVVTEPFSEWVLSGRFAGGRPRWEDAGATFTDDIAPFEERKLWLLNGGHSLLAYAGSARGHESVADSVADEACRGWLEAWWGEASRHLTLPAEDLERYREALLERFANPRMRHLLAQIAADGSQKLPIRVLPVLRAERSSGRLPDGAMRVLAAWICHLRGAGAPVADPRGDELVALAAGPLPEAVRRILEDLDPAMAADDELVAGVLERAGVVTPAEVIVGLDVGTTSVKAVAFGVGASWRRVAIREYPLLNPGPGLQVQDPEAIVAATAAALAECVAAADRAPILAIALTTAMHGLIALDDDLQPLTPLVTWADSRSREQAAELRALGSARELHRRSGAPVHPMTPLTKLLWFARHEPETFAAARYWVGLKDFLLHRLTGRLVTELSSASGTGLLDMATRTWNADSISLTGITEDQLPPILATTATLPLAAGPAARMGLPSGLPVVTGAADGPVGNLGTGALSPGVAGLSLGTSGAIRMVVPEPKVDEQGTLFCYALTDTAWVVGGAISNGGVVVRWAGSSLAPDVAGDEALLALAATAPAGCDGLMMLPYLLAERAPLWDPDLPGAYLGLRRRHTRAHLIRAAVEGVSLQLKVVLDHLEILHPVESVNVTGGTFRSSLWRDVVAATLERPLHVVGDAEGTALGAAALGLFALERAPDLHGALVLLSHPEAVAPERVDADPALVATYRRQRATLPALIGALAAVGEVLAGEGEGSHRTEPADIGFAARGGRRDEEGGAVIRPTDTATRERKPLSDLWRFALDTGDTGRRERWLDRPLPGDLEPPVPAGSVCYSSVHVDGNKKGVFTRERRPKSAAQHLRRRWRM